MFVKKQTFGINTQNNENIWFVNQRNFEGFFEGATTCLGCTKLGFVSRMRMRMRMSKTVTETFTTTLTEKQIKICFCDEGGGFLLAKTVL